MKQYSFLKLLFIICVGFVSCSKEDTPEVAQGEKQLLIKKVSEEIYYSGEVEKHSLDFNYEKGILKSISEGTHKSELTYDGEKIIKISSFNNSELTGVTTFFYEGDVLKYGLAGESQDEKTVFTYSSNGVLSSTKYGYLTDTQFVILGSTKFTFDANGNLVETLEHTSNGGIVSDSKEISTYDNKNNPMKFMNKYLRILFGFEGFKGLNVNNEISRDYFYPISTTTPSKKSFEIIYNADDFPIEIKKYRVPANSLISKTTIEYQ